MKQVTISFVTQEWNPISAAIRYGTHSKYSHVEAITDDHKRLGALSKGGVQIRDYDYDKFTSELQLSFWVTSQQHRIFWDFLNNQVGKPYDKWAIAAFIIPSIRKEDWRDNSHWFCSELIGAAEEQIGLFNYTPLLLTKNSLSPGDCALITRPFSRIVHEYN
jgi:hypothetical protein